MAARAAVVVAVCVLLVGVHGFREPLACSIRCCTFSPRCLGATHMSCHCPDTNTVGAVSRDVNLDPLYPQMQLRSGDIPSTVQYIEIFPAQSVTIGPRALYDLYGLRDLTVRDVHSLEVLSDGLALPEAASLQTLRLDRIRQVTLRQDALSGRWPADAELEMHHIGNMHMEQRALHFEADGAGPRVLLENVADLHAKSDAFRATVKHLILVNVSMRACQPGTFRGKEHIYAEIGPNPVVADYADPRDSLAFRGERDEAAVERGQYAEIAPLVGDPELAERAPPPPSSPPPVGR
ncbi:hypothetical protein FJT64_001488 [Amphibalanus amphitrite]|uniref:Uncharacterized protein n=1 Tax=Amphibalanus amphitrite TaxID=1232801 RepID=A0A6A4VA83_AMPAM|nr:hypothetical protein FJT64_001488 [Amphibalanus amphitrite]